MGFLAGYLHHLLLLLHYPPKIADYIETAFSGTKDT